MSPCTLRHLWLRIKQETARCGEMGGGISQALWKPALVPSPTPATVCPPDSVSLLGSLRGVRV